MSPRTIRLVRGDDSTCPKCGGTNMVVRTYSDTVDYRDLELDVEGLQNTKCNQCNYVWTTVEQTNQNNALIRNVYATERDRIRVAQGLLSGPDIARIRDQLGLNQREAAAVFGGGYNAFNKYESGEVLQSFAMDRLLRLSEAVGKLAVVFLRDISGPPPFVVIPKSTSSSSTMASFSQEPRTYGKLQTLVSSGTSTDGLIPFIRVLPQQPLSNEHRI